MVVAIVISLLPDLEPEALTSELSRVDLVLLLLHGQLLQGEHLSVLVSGELFVLFPVQCSEGRRGGRDRLVYSMGVSWGQEVVVRGCRVLRGGRRRW